MPHKTATYHLDAETQARAASCIRLAYKLANRFARKRGLDPDEVASVALEQLCRAAARFDPAQGFKFTTYAGVTVERALLRFAMYESRRRVRARCFSDMGAEDDHYFDPADGKAPAPERLSCCTSEVLAKIRKRLPPRLWFVLHLRFAEGQTFREIGEALGVVNQRAQQLLQKALERARWIAGVDVPDAAPAANATA